MATKGKKIKTSMEQIKFKFNDGGRSLYFKAAGVGDCAVRATAIASGRDYKEIYDLFRKACKGSPRDGVDKKVIYKVMEQLGATWTPTMEIGNGCKVHLRPDELPQGRIVCNCSRHLVAVIDGVINDTYDSSRGGRRCVYGYWKFN